jgi:hypothetical protein
MRTSSSAIILAGLAAATAVVGGTARGGDDCLAAPNATAPQGSHWYYRFDRAAHRKCWYVGAQGAKVRHAGAATPPATRPSAATAAADGPAPTPAAAPVAAVAAVPDAAFALRWPDAPTPAGATDSAPAMGMSDRIAARAVTTTAERAPAAPAQRQPERIESTPATAAADERPSLPAALAGIAALLAVLGTILVRAGRRAAATRSPHWADSVDEGATRAAGPSLWDEVPRGRGRDAGDEPTWSEPVPDIADATLQPAIDPLPAETIDAAPDVEQSLRQLLQAWERRAA